MRFDIEPTPYNTDELLEKLNLDHAFTEMLRAMTRITISPNIIRGGIKTNIVPDSCEGELDIRILPGQNADYVLQELFQLLGAGVETALTEYQEPTFTSSQTEPYWLIAELTEELAAPNAVCLPIISTGSTDSKYLRNIGIPAYGIGHMDAGYDPDISTTMHGCNERTDIKSLYLKTRFLVELARRYLS